MHEARPAEPRGKRYWVWVGVVILGLAAAGSGFVFKLTEFIKVAQTGEAEGFAVVPVVTYFCVTAGFVCLFVWNYLHGGFHDVERPKYDMLQRHEEIDRHDLGVQSPPGRA